MTARSITLGSAALFAFLLLALAILVTIDFIWSYCNLYATWLGVRTVLASGYVGIVIGFVAGFCVCGRAMR